MTQRRLFPELMSVLSASHCSELTSVSTGAKSSSRIKTTLPGAMSENGYVCSVILHPEFCKTALKEGVNAGEPLARRATQSSREASLFLCLISGLDRYAEIHSPAGISYTEPNLCVMSCRSPLGLQRCQPFFCSILTKLQGLCIWSLEFRLRVSFNLFDIPRSQKTR